MSSDNFSQELWQACEAHYQTHEALCLKLQDDCQINVNLLLLAAELDKRAISLNLGQWQQLIVEVSSWDERLIGPYRRLRQLAKSSLSPEEYRQMLDVELMMERKVQKMLLTRLNQYSPGAGRENLPTLLAEFGIDVALVAALAE